METPAFFAATKYQNRIVNDIPKDRLYVRGNSEYFNEVNLGIEGMGGECDR